jgi:hypothetical protein
MGHSNLVSGPELTHKLSNYIYSRPILITKAMHTCMGVCVCDQLHIVAAYLVVMAVLSVVVVTVVSAVLVVVSSSVVAVVCPSSRM